MNTSTPPDTLYRFRGADALLDKYQELENQTIYFASPDELNDPMEGFRDRDVESVAKVVFRNLKKNPKTYLDGLGFSHYVEELGSPLFSKENHRLSHSDHAAVLEAITLLERRGLVVRNITRRGSGGHEDQFVVYLTSIGIKSNIDDEVILLVDKPEEIVRVLEEKTRDLDEVVRQYYLESLRAYQEGLYISSIICLGAASERAIHWLAESIESYSEIYQGQIEKRRDGNIFRLTEYLSNTIIPNTFGHDKNFADELKKRLNGLGNLYRENRNEAGHPQTVDQSWLGEDQEYLLIQFRRYLTTICDAIGKII